MALQERLRPAERPLATPGVLRKTFQRADFLENLIEMSNHLQFNFSESAFTVSNFEGIPFVSHLNKSRKIGSIENAHDSLSVGVEFFDDTFLFIHGHPLILGRNLKESLIPSNRDLEAWEELKMNRTEIIEGVFTRQGNKGLLLLFQEDPKKIHNNYHQGWDGKTIDGFLKTLDESGIRHQILGFDLKRGRFSQHELTKLNSFI